MSPRTGLVLLALAACTDRPGVGSDATTTGDTTAAPSTTSDVPTDPPAPTSTTSTSTPTPGEDTHEHSDCGEALLLVSPPRPAVVLALDKTGTMVAEGSWWDHDGDPATPTQSRWRSVHAAVEDFLTTHDAALVSGLVLFPAKLTPPVYGPEACMMDTTDVAIAPDNAAAILAALPPADSDDLVGATPMRTAVELARADLESAADLPRHIVVLTDGAANCIADAPDVEALLETHDPDLLPAVAGARAAGVTTHFIGVVMSDVTTPVEKDGLPDATNPRDALHALALAGGAPVPGDTAFHDVTDEPGLRAALTAIAAELLPCTGIALEPPPKYPDFVELVVGDSTYPDPLDACADQPGWRWTDATFTAVELCGQACADYRRDGSLDARYPCPGGA